MTVWPGDALFGQDGTAGDGTADGVGPLPGFELPVVRMPTLGPAGEIIGLDGDGPDGDGDTGDGDTGDGDTGNDETRDGDTGDDTEVGSDDEVAAVEDGEPPASRAAAEFHTTGRPPANAGRVVVSMGLAPAEPAVVPESDPVADPPPLPVTEPEPPDAAAPGPPLPSPMAATSVAATSVRTPPHGLPTAARFAVPAPPSTPVLPRPYARPPVVDDAGIIGLTRVSRSKVGSRLFTWFFVLVFALIVVQMVVALLSV